MEFEKEVFAYEFSLDALEYPLIFIINDNLIKKWLDFNLAPYLSVWNGQNNNEKNFYIYIHKNEANTFHILTKDINITVNVYEIETFLQSLINCKCILKKDYFFLHCALVEINNKNVMLIGGSESGKSTLTAFLHYNKFSCITDDKLIVNSKNGRLFPFIRNILLRKESLEILNNYGFSNLNLNHIELYTYNREELVVQTTKYKHGIDIAIQLDLKHGLSDCNIVDLDFCSAFELILFNGYISNNIKQKIKPAIELTKMIKCYKMTYFDLKKACDEIVKLINHN